MSGILGPGVECRFHNGLDLIVLGALRTGLAGWFALQTGHAPFQEMVAPQNDRWPTGVELLRDTTVGQAFMRQQANACSQHNFLRRRWSLNPLLQMILLFVRQGK